MLEEELHFLLLNAFHHSSRRITQEILKLGLLPGQPKILEYLTAHDGAMAREIGRGCALDKSTVASLLTRMESQGLIKRAGSESDRRVSYVYLTEKGRKLGGRVKEICLRVDSLALRRIPGEKREEFLRMLRMAADGLEEDTE